MRKVTASAAASLLATGMMASLPASADVELDACFTIMDQLWIEESSDQCTLIIQGDLIEDRVQGPYTLKVDASGNLLCTALEGKYLASYSPVRGVVRLDPIWECGDGGCKVVGQDIVLQEIGPDSSPVAEKHGWQVCP